MVDVTQHRYEIGQGFLRLIDVMGDDAAIVQAARVSYGEGTKTVREDRALIRHLMRKRHTSPFEMCEVKVHIKIQMDAWRQMVRHRTANLNEYSTRYSVAIEECKRTLPGEWRSQSSTNKQGSDGFIDLGTGLRLSQEEHEIQQKARLVYEGRLKEGVAREQARKDLPLCNYTEAYWKIDLHNLLHFLSLRLDPAAQLEIRQYAQALSHIVRDWVPLTWEAFVDYRLESISLSRWEIETLSRVNRLVPWEDYAQTHMSSSEVKDFLSKLSLLGYSVKAGVPTGELNDTQGSVDSFNG